MNFNYNIQANNFKGNNLNTGNSRVNVKSPAQFKSPLIRDTFKKTTTVQQPAKITDKSIQALFDATWDKVLKQIPITKELNMSKPILILGENNDNTVASYNIGANSIEIKSDMSEDFYIYYLETDEGKQPLNVANKSAGDERYKNNPQVKTIKLTEKEKELYIKSIFAHEIRHCIQDHLILSTEGCEDARNIMKQASQDLKSSIQNLLYIYNEMKKFGSDKNDEKIKKLEAEIARSNYIENYKPKKMLKSDTKLKFSIIPSDTRYLSVINHLAKSTIDKKIDNKNYDYDFDPKEIDAYNYQNEYFLTQKPKEQTDNIRKNVIDMISLYNILYCGNIENNTYGGF